MEQSNNNENLKTTEELGNRQRKTFMAALIVSVIAIIALAVYGTYAFYVLPTLENNESKASTIDTANLSTEIIEGTITGGNLIPGDTIVKTFQVVNNSSVSVTYGIFMKDITNEFINQDDLVITLKENNVAIIEESSAFQFPATGTADIMIKTNLTVAANTTKNYELTITYKNSTNNQVADMDKTLKATIGIKGV